MLPLPLNMKKINSSDCQRHTCVFVLIGYKIKSWNYNTVQHMQTLIPGSGECHVSFVD